MQGRLDDVQDVVVGVDLGGTKTALLVAGAATGGEIGRQSFSTDCDAGPDRMLDTIYAGITATLERAGRNMSQLRAVGFAVPGLVNDEGCVLDGGKLVGWSNFDLRGRSVRDLGVKTFVEHDANTAALGERWRGVAKDMRSFVFLALGTGLGAGIMIDGRLYRGAHHAAGEVGNMVPGRALFDLGSPGEHNLGGLIGGQAIRDQAAHVAGVPLSAAEALRRAAEDERLEPLADRVADYVAIGVINIAALLDPEAIIFGGGTSSAGGALLNRVQARVKRELPIRPKLLYSSLGEDAQLEGAILGARWQLNPSLLPHEVRR
jgi:glucokinase